MIVVFSIVPTSDSNHLTAFFSDYKIDDNIEITLSLVSIDENKKEYDREDFESKFFLKENSKIVDRATEMSVEVPKTGSVLIGLYQK